MCRWPFFVVKIDNAKGDNYLLLPIPPSCDYKPFDGAFSPSTEAQALGDPTEANIYNLHSTNLTNTIKTNLAS